jgi:hypothetical protein
MDVRKTAGCAQNVVVGSLLQGEDDHALEFTAPLWSWKTSCFFFSFLSEDPCLSLLSFDKFDPNLLMFDSS